MRFPSEKQLSFIDKLIVERSDALQSRNDLINHPLDSMDDASHLIDGLLKLPVNRDPEMPEVVAKASSKGDNGKARACTECGNVVPVGEGYYYGLPNGGYGTIHKVGKCLPKVTTPDPATLKEIGPGFYKLGDEYVQVYVTRYNRLGTHVLSNGGKWVYQSGYIMRLRSENSQQITSEEALGEACFRKYGAYPGTEELRVKAVEYGVSSGKCIFCNKVLTDDRSNPALGGVGYGPDCAEHYNLPWGKVTLINK